MEKKSTWKEGMELGLMQNVYTYWEESHRTMKLLCLSKRRLMIQTVPVFYCQLIKWFYCLAPMRFYLGQRRHWIRASSKGRPWELCGRKPRNRFTLHDPCKQGPVRFQWFFLSLPGDLRWLIENQGSILERKIERHVDKRQIRKYVI